MSWKLVALAGSGEPPHTHVGTGSENTWRVIFLVCATPLTVYENAAPLLSAILLRGATLYRAPSWLREQAKTNSFKWRIVALDSGGNRLAETGWRNLRFDPAR